jgi:hypothetical protein
VIDVGELTVKLLALVEPNLTALTSRKPTPVIVTGVPPLVGPRAWPCFLFGGLTLAIVGGGPKAKPRSVPAAMPAAPLTLLTSTGVVLQDALNTPQRSGPLVIPSPSSPAALMPQALTAPLLDSARACSPRAATAVTLRPLTATGLLLQANFVAPASHVSGPSMVPSPSSPCSLRPQASTFPVPSRASTNVSPPLLSFPPAEMAVTPLR